MSHMMSVSGIITHRPDHERLYELRMSRMMSSCSATVTLVPLLVFCFNLGVSGGRGTKTLICGILRVKFPLGSDENVCGNVILVNEKSARQLVPPLYAPCDPTLSSPASERQG